MLILAAAVALSLTEPLCQPEPYVCPTTVPVDGQLARLEVVAQPFDAAQQQPDPQPTPLHRPSAVAPYQAATQDVPPPAEHTGLETLVKDLISDFKAFPRRESTWVILGVGGAT